MVASGPPALGQALDAPVTYNARDSIRYDLQQQIVYLFGAAQVQYKGVALTADRIEYHFKNEEARAHGVPDSSGAVVGKPAFDQEGHRIEADSIRYNFRTQEGLIKEVRTSEQETYVQARVSKRHGDGEVHSKGGLLTTCDRPRPHYHFRASRMLVIPDDKIVTGAAVMKVGPVPTPIAIPFGFFPNKRGGTSGVLMPTYGESPTLGFFLLNGFPAPPSPSTWSSPASTPRGVWSCCWSSGRTTRSGGRGACSAASCVRARACLRRPHASSATRPRSPTSRPRKLARSRDRAVIPAGGSSPWVTWRCCQPIAWST